MPSEITSKRSVLNAIERVKAISELTSRNGDHYEYELDLEVSVYGRNYNGKRVGPYIRLLEYAPGEEIVREGDWGANCFYAIVEGAADVFIGTASGELRVSELKAGIQFGEMSVLAGVPRAATVRASTDGSAHVLEIQRPALRLLRKMETFSKLLDATYRANGRKATLQDIGQTIQLAPELLKYLESTSDFRVFSKNHILFREGEQIRRLYVLRTGWAHLTRGEPVSNERYVGPIHCFGVDGIARDGVWSETCTLLGRAEVLEISLVRLRQNSEHREGSRVALGKASPEPQASPIPIPVIQSQHRLIETGLVDGTNLLLMDMGMCIRCGNCSLACHKVHGQSRLVRRGIQVTRPKSPTEGAASQSLLSPSVCMHCKDPECLTGCPTGAIQRFQGGQVDIDPKTCIGCGDCATQCPYNAISMTGRKPPAESAASGWLWKLSPDPMPPAVEQTDDLLAVKCNLCAGTGLNPEGSKQPAFSCEENCPTGALLRVDPHTYFAEIRNIENLISRDQTHGIARHVSHRDRVKQVIHAAGLALTLLLTGLTVMGLAKYGFERPLVSTWLNMRWVTGLAGLAGILGVMTYPVRRQVYRRRAGPLRYWLLAHTYLGVVAGLVLLLHGGTSSGGLLTTLLMVSFDLVIATGLLGAALYYVIPRLLTRIEEQPLLIEDLIARKAELADEIAADLSELPAQLQSTIKRQVIARLLSFSYLVKLILSRSTLDQQITNSQRILDNYRSGDESSDAGGRSVMEKLTILRRVDALIFLHRSLKIWLIPHVLTTSLMLCLMLVHIIQVIYFAAG